MLWFKIEVRPVPWSITLSVYTHTILIMKNIIVFNDLSSAAENAAKVAANIARKLQVNLLIVNLVGASKRVMVNSEGLIVAENGSFYEKAGLPVAPPEGAENINDAFSPKTIQIDAWHFSERDLIQLVLKNDTLMMVQGVNNYHSTPVANVQAILNRVNCPLLLVPQNYQEVNFERLIYTADLRYCRLAIVRYMADLARTFDATLMVAHLSADGLPHMEDSYARVIFDNEIASKVKYNKLGFNNIRERNLGQVVDVMVNGMQADMLAMINHKFHFEEIIGHSMDKPAADGINIPVLVFPC